MQRADLLEKTLMLGKFEGRRRRGPQRVRWLGGITDSMGHEFEQAPGDGEGQRSLVCCSPWGHKELNMTGQMSNGNKCEVLVCLGCCNKLPQPGCHINSRKLLLTTLGAEILRAGCQHARPGLSPRLHV